MKKLFLVFAVLCGLLMAGCAEFSDSNGSPGGSGGDIQVTFSDLTANGSGNETTTKLFLTFSQDISGLSVADISLTPALIKGTLTRESNGFYELEVSGITAGGQVSATVSKSGYIISGSPKNVQVYFFAPGTTPVLFNSLIADGSATTTKLTLTFNTDIAGLSAADITLLPALTKGTLTRVSTGVYDLPVSGITAGGQVNVTVSKSGFTINPSSRNVTVNFFSAGSEECPDCEDDPCSCGNGGNECTVCGNAPCSCGTDVGIGIGNPSIKLYKDGILVQGNSTAITQGTGTYSVSITSGTYLEIIWYLNGNEVTRDKTSIIMSSQTPGTYIVSVEAILLGGVKNSGSHSFEIR